MKAIVKAYLNLRTGAPSVNALNPQYCKPRDVVDQVTGDKYKHTNVWYLLNNGGYVQSGGTDVSIAENSDAGYGW